MIAQRLDVLFSTIRGSEIFLSTPNHPFIQADHIALFNNTVKKSQTNPTIHISEQTTVLQMLFIHSGEKPI